ncbi:aldo/keto reductase [Clavibacter michiganensis]|uniref:L-glyceraldehyde 3-phosphate reductase n=2 Tax=Clavibacter michiganensis subsp. michiganensis TaxID=33013 RepID=A0A1Y3FGD7_CLAMM|nr:aldo/keto reductase [Clavibacter michiganensis]KAF0257793.1 L-glyceraldehyde 3-phosphate reductase [Clavibacter michiganensis subsp. michiganensis]MBE3077729.1 aldo/keto reductase [Clavibacter michiganensis subsp. michiganensis]MBF4637285.1 aldo/keto reductase [Clavibacter michiganensis subsp. michiganensis]MBW8025534.1 aldo/keto reductase [Clavibacter michiganensis subsp. michiganensis]MDO4018839.1 aldo/keto reductase [Clavibacter michiganensis]
MRYVKLGSTGTEVSAIALGCMSYGEPTRGNHAWTLGEEDSIPLIRRAVELGITFFDTANVYSDGSSEEITGRALKAMTKREEIVIATKVHGAMGEGPNSRGLSRKHIMWQIDESLRRLGTDYVDLYQIHRFDPATPLEETLEALDDLVRAGKVRYLGASSMDAWRFSKALHLQRANGWARFVTMQDHYNLVNREEEREMLPLCADEGVGSLPWSPLARGRLTRDWDATTDRSETDEFGKTLYAAQEDSDRRVAAAVAEVAGARGVPRAQVALAWVSRNPVVTAPIVGGTKVAHIEDAVASLDLELTADEVSLLEEHYVPHAVVGY